MSNFLYLFRGGDEQVKAFSQEEKEYHMVLWQKWMGSLAEKGHLLDGLPLARKGKVVGDKGEVITEGPFAEGAELIGGYLIVSAKDLNKAVEISKSCPIFIYKGTTVEVREILTLDI